MPTPASFFAVLPLVLLLTGAATAQPVSVPGAVVSGRHSITLSRMEPREVPELPLGPELLTTLLFGAPLRLAGVDLEAREHFSRVTVLEDALLLVPSPSLEAGRKLRLRVRFVDGSVPASADFVLVLDASRTESHQVNVGLRRPQDEGCGREAEQERVKAQQCQTELAQVRQQPQGLTGLLAAGLLDAQGITVRRLAPKRDFTQRSGEALTVGAADTYRALGRVAVELTVASASTRPWMGVGAELVGEGGVRLRVLRVWQAEPVIPGARGQRVVVEAEAAETESLGRFTLSLWQEGQTENVTVEGVVFP